MTTQFSIEEFRDRIAWRRQEDDWPSKANLKSTISFRCRLFTSDYKELKSRMKQIKILNPDHAIPKEYHLAFTEWKEYFLFFFKNALTELDLKTQAVVERPLSYSKRHLETLYNTIFMVSSLTFLNKDADFFSGKRDLLRLAKIVESKLMNLKIQAAKERLLWKWSSFKGTETPQVNEVSILGQQAQNSGYFQWIPIDLFGIIYEHLPLQDLSNLMTTNRFLYNQVQNFCLRKCTAIQTAVSSQAEKKLESCQIDFPVFYKNSDVQNLTCFTVYENLIFAGLDDHSIKILEYDWRGNFQELQTLPEGRLRTESLLVTKTKLYLISHCEIRILKKKEDGIFTDVQVIQKPYKSPITSFKVFNEEIYILSESKIEIWKEDEKGNFILFQAIDSHPNLSRRHLQIRGDLLFTGSTGGIIETYKRATDGKFNWMQDLVSAQCQRIVYLDFLDDFLISQGDDNGAVDIWRQNSRGKFEIIQHMRLLGRIDSMMMKGKYCFIGMHNLNRHVLTVFKIDPFGKFHPIESVKNEEGIILDIKAIGNLLFTLSTDQSIKMWIQGKDGKFSEPKKLSNSGQPIENGSLLLENWHLFVFNQKTLTGTVQIFQLLEEEI
jgi:WD40 repeat protein